ncbi:MAG TPA: helix-turn-helix domain-containing protein [archaeon]|nr:helix-turn-helix domain-containing protein [archaeon]
MNQCLESLQALGLSRNEAKVYLSLLRYNPVTGYRLSKSAGIRRSVVYDALHRLIERGAVYTTAGDPVKYVPVPYDKFLDTLKADFERSISSIREKLDQASYTFSLEYIYHIKGEKNVRNEIFHMIEKAERELLLELWLTQYEDLKSALSLAEKRGVKIFTMLFSDSRTEELGQVFYHNYMPLQVVETRLKGRHTIVVRDNSETLIGKMLQEDNSWAVTTGDQALVMVAREFIIHDIMIDLLINKFGKEKLEQVWLSNPDIYSIVLDRLSTAP